MEFFKNPIVITILIPVVLLLIKIFLVRANQKEKDGVKWYERGFECGKWLSATLNLRLGKGVTSELEQGLLISLKYRVFKLFDGIVDGALSDNEELEKRVKKATEGTEAFKVFKDPLNKQ